ncbi:acetyl-CoA synthetase-like protein [Neoconidiobolus thromboides FSU 785]|nr:acetyl-CoA synthetase-like protein [Neoconidiobolus thromboides FSU 785]
MTPSFEVSTIPTNTTGESVHQAIYKLNLTEDSPPPATIYHLFQQSCNQVPNQDFLGTREKINNTLDAYVFQTYSQVYTRVLNFSNGLHYLVNKYQLFYNKQLKTIGIYSTNCSEWVISDLSNCFKNLITVGLYTTYNKFMLEYVIAHSEIEILILSRDRLRFLINNEIKLAEVKIIIIIEEIKPNELITSWTKKQGIIMYTFKQIESIGKKNNYPIAPPSSDSIYTICYTSGTTNLPKGVLSTHQNYIASLLTKQKSFSNQTKLTTYSYLPLAHTMGRASIFFIISMKARVGFVSDGDIRNFNSDIKELKPNYLAAVPKILTRIYEQVMKASEGKGEKAKLLKLAIEEKLKDFKNGNGVENPKYEYLFDKFQQVIGGKVKFLAVGSAPISVQALDVLKVVLSTNIIEGYGSTETAAAISITNVFNNDTGSVGRPYINTEIKLVNIPEMGYLTTDSPYPRGEIYVRGPTVFNSYFKDEKATKEALTKDHWFKTGDIGKIDDIGRLFIVDRKSHILKLGNGEFISPERIENVIKRNKLVEQVIVYGNSLKSHLVALIVPNELEIIKWSKQRSNLMELDFKQVCENKELKKLLLIELQNSCIKGGLAKFELIKNIYLHSLSFTIDNGYLTDTFKIKRRVIIKDFKHILDDLYE